MLNNRFVIWLPMERSLDDRVEVVLGVVSYMTPNNASKVDGEAPSKYFEHRPLWICVLEFSLDYRGVDRRLERICCSVFQKRPKRD